MNNPRKIGTATETAVVKFLRSVGFPHAERRALRGAQDAGDITGTPGICWSVKGGQMARRASDQQVAEWLHELARQTLRAQADYGVLVVQRAGIGAANAGRWWAVMQAWQVECLTSKTGRWNAAFRFPLRMALADAVALLRHAGYGTEVR